ncbi:MAG: cobalamin biosynthesis protein CbiM [Spirochaetes bacterium RBG_16_67_19]|nr:MAG: cobalamin biosynthesis protein CbiM [Spirochaetes bacterium RBG_16_67_19]
MHIPDGFLSAPVWVAAGAMSVAAVAVSAGRLGKTMEEKQVPLMGVTAAFIFAAQMVNFPIAAGTSGHLGGGVLAALLLGPWAGTLVMTAVLVVQALLFQDGGITALGANVLNMGVLGCLLGFVVYRLLHRLLAGTRGALASAFVTAWLMVVLSSSLAAIQIALSGTIPLRLVLPAMAGVHALIGIGEGLITTAALAFLLRVRKDLVHPQCRPFVRRPAEQAA